jgi:hypothetical protein
VKFSIGGLIIGGAALFLGIQLLRQRGATFNVTRYRLAIPEGRPVLELYTEIFNPSDLPIQLGDIQLQVSLQGVILGNIIPLRTYTLPEKKRSRIILPLNLTGGGQPLISALLKAESQNNPIRLTGSFTAGGIKQTVNTEIRSNA